MIKWKDISGYEGIYQISDSGIIKNKKTGRIRKPSKTHDGYYHIVLHRNGKAKTFLIHRIVASLFIGDADGLEVNHLDSVRTNNNVSNLSICTKVENAHNGDRIDRIARKRSIPVVQLNKDGELIAEFYGGRQASRSTGIPHQHIWGCCNGTHPSAGGFIWKYKTDASQE